MQYDLNTHPTKFLKFHWITKCWQNINSFTADHRVILYKHLGKLFGNTEKWILYDPTEIHSHMLPKVMYNSVRSSIIYNKQNLNPNAHSQ